MIIHLLLVLITFIEVRGHGRLIEPPSRSSMWRFGFNTERNFNDHELFCGGYTVQWKMNKGKCGICGDPWHMPQPRENEAGGKYGKGIIVRNYASGQVINATAQLTANHKGYFEFKICPTDDPLMTATQDCLDQYPLQVVETSTYKYVLPDNQPRDFTLHLKLPKDLECTHCVFQWTYTSGNNWGPCPGGGSATGCGPQETFRGCADVRILGNSNESDNMPSMENNELTPKCAHKNRRDDTLKNENSENTGASQSDTILLATDSTNDISVAEKTQDDSPNEETTDNTELTEETKVEMPKNYDSCKGTGVWKTLPNIDTWCVNNCSKGYCPSSHCQCNH